jgi:hypothetical protein
MKLKQCALYLLSAGLITAGGSVVAAEQSSFAALANVETQGLSTQEMQAVTGELNAGQIAFALSAAAAKVCSPALATALTNASAAVTLNAGAINTFLTKVGVYTP